ncbi:MAG: formimidoylglutamate deiminase [Alphaproteobacteria bacterium]
MPVLKFDHLYSAGGWLSPGYLSVGADGSIAGISGEAPAEGAEAVGGIAVPGMPNLHSHAFQRAMAGLSEYRTAAAEDSFWTWRDLMYRFVGRLTPDDLEAIAAQLYVEMLKSGFTAVGEFQYLHHDRDGTGFDTPAEMSLRTLAAARTTGIGTTLLPVLYQHAGFGGQPPGDGQRRFINDTGAFLEIYQTLAKATGPDPDRHTGIAPHSLRAADADSFREVAASVDSSAPIHIHIAEQEKEVADCLEFSGRRPVEYLLENADVDGRWCLVHATHMTVDEVRNAATCGAIAGLCPTTEANLGDGIFDLPGWQAADGALGIGSDSHISVSVVEELRWLEYGQRLRDRRRNVAADATTSTGTRLFDAAIAGGAQALARKGPNGETGLQAGARADIVVLDADAPIFAGHTVETFLDAWIFSGNESVVTDVFVGGAHVVSGRHHPQEEEIASRYGDVVRAVLS